MADIVLPFFNGYPHLDRCLRSLAASIEFEHRLYLVDDGSAAEAAEGARILCHRLDLDFELLRHRNNRGYKESIRTGIAACRGKHVILLNSDTILTPAFDHRLLESLALPAVAAVAPVSNHPTDLYQFRPGLEIDTGEVEDLQAAVRHRARLAADVRPRTTSAAYLTGMCLALDREILDAVGVFHDDYRHGYFEDLALCCEMRALGYELLVREDCFVYHQGHATYGQKTQDEKARIVDHNFRIFTQSWGHLPDHADLLAKMDYAGKVCPL
jgi:GT2 family glycosyltransferase